MVVLSTDRLPIAPDTCNPPVGGTPIALDIDGGTCNCSVSGPPIAPLIFSVQRRYVSRCVRTYVRKQVPLVVRD